MTDYQSIQEHCQKTTAAGKSVLDEFLLSYAAGRERMHREMDTRFAKYRHVTQLFDPTWVDYLKSQYVAHRIFKKDGLIRKYLNHRAVKDLREEKQQFLRQQSARPWRFSFSVITGRPADDFYQMEDVFTSEKFLLYSTGVTKIASQHEVMLWFNLIAFNGMCWQSFGPIAHYQSFGPDDIRYYASERNPRQWFENDKEIMENVEKDPVPYMMLMKGATLPVIVRKGELVSHHFAEYTDDAFSTDELKPSFRIEYNEGVYRLSLKKWNDPPHYATAYYEEQQELLLVYAMTARGFAALIKKLNQCGYDLDPDPDFQVNASMFSTAQDILKKEHITRLYSKLFEEPATLEEAEEMDKLNAFLALAISDLNNGREPDVNALAKKAGVDPEAPRQMIGSVLKKLGKK